MLGTEGHYPLCFIQYVHVITEPWFVMVILYVVPGIWIWFSFLVLINWYGGDYEPILKNMGNIEKYQSKAKVQQAGAVTILPWMPYD